MHAMDVIVGAAAPFIAIFIRDVSYFDREDMNAVLIYSGIATIATLACLLHFRVTQILSRFFSIEDIRQIIKASAVAALITAGVVFSLVRLEVIPRSLPVLHFVVLAIGLIGIRWLRSEQYRTREIRADETSGSVQNVLLVGASRMAWFYIRMLGCVPGSKQRVIAILDDDPKMQGRSLCGVPVIGMLSRAESVLVEYETHGIGISRIIVTSADEMDRDAANTSLAALCAERGLVLDFMADRLDLVGADEAGGADPVYAARPTPPATAQYYLRLRRVFDMVLAGVAIVICAPLFVLTGLAVLIDVGMPAVFWQERIGRNGVPIFVHKFRTLRAPMDRHGNPVPEEQRLSRIGRFLRASRLDELPQLFDILRGAMSLIGPRPLLPVDMPNDASIRLQVRPGLTGWAQVHGGKLITAEEKNALDEWYINHVSPSVDFRIICLTMLTSIRGDRRKEKAVSKAVRFQKQRLRTAVEPNDERAAARPQESVNHRAA